jgi:ATP-dependent helicase HrpB
MNKRLVFGYICDVMEEKNLSLYDIRKEFAIKMQHCNQLILYAPTGSGKSTLVPRFLIDDILPSGKSVIILQPRRIAARLLAGFIARERGSLPGEEVGYQIRLESKKSASTRILFVTEGILLNRLFNHDTLTEAGAIVFDEFHERHLETDLSLSLAVKLQKEKRPDLKIIVMSATLDIAKVDSMLTNAEILKTEGRKFPVTIKYLQPRPSEPPWESAVNGLEAALPEFKEGSALIFMPGVYEIRKTIEALQKRSRLQSFGIYPLHGSLPGNDQDKAVQPGERKIIVATNVAETSLTIPGVTLVIDNGTARVSRFDPKRGINTLFIEPISKSSADQRAGRAGRVAPGQCIRLWSEFSHEHRQESTEPEIHRLDLSETIIALLAAGEDPNSFTWVEAPGKAAIERAFTLLHQLSAVDSGQKLTQLGYRMSKLNMHPRLARMMVEAERLGCLPSASLLVAITQTTGFISTMNDPVIKQERLDMFGNCGSDLIFELNAWLWAGRMQFKSDECSRLGINSRIARDIGKVAVQILQKISYKAHHLPQRIDSEEATALRKCLFAGFSDFVAIRHRMNSPTCQMMHGRSGQLHRESCVQEARYMVVNQMEESKSPAGIQVFLRKVTEIESDWLTADLINDVKRNVSYTFNKETSRFIKVIEVTSNMLVLSREQSEIDDDEIAAQIIANAIRTGEIPFPQWDENVEHYVRRVNFAAEHAPHYQIPAILEEEKDFIIQQSVYTCRSLKEIQKCNIWPALKSWLSYEQLEAVNVVAPEMVMLPHRKKPVKLRYDVKGDVILSETIQALYDCPLPITVAEGKVAVVFELLAPSRRPVQITRDLEYFWKNSYHDIKKELKGRYPKHEWR